MLKLFAASLALTIASVQFDLTEGRTTKCEHDESNRGKISSDQHGLAYGFLLERISRMEAANERLTKRLDTVEEENAVLNKQFVHLVSANVDLAARVADLTAQRATLEERVEYLEAITRKNVPQTCEDLRRLGIAKSGEFLIDPDGAGIGEAPVLVYCDMRTGSTIVRHNVNGPVEVEHCPDPGCHKTEVTYEIPEKQISALVRLSAACSQPIEYTCFVAPLLEADINLAWWVGSQNQANYYWDGNHSSDSHVCACDAAGGCSNPVFQCNCDSNAPQWMSDKGILTNLDDLPVRELLFGGLLYEGQQATFELGGLQCAGKKSFQTTESCETLRMAGATSSGYYLIDGDNAAGLHYRAVLCNMDLEPGNDPNFQVVTQLTFPEYPVAFDFSRTHDYAVAGSVVPFTVELLNAGGAMSMDGSFVAPFDGVYAFTFSFTDGSGWNTGMQIRLNAATISGSDSLEGSGSGIRDSASQTVILALAKEDVVDVYLESGAIISSPPFSSHFTGTLLYPL